MKGFGGLSPEKQFELRSRGGKTAHALGTAHKWTSEEAQAAGRKGGKARAKKLKMLLSEKDN